MAGKDGPEQEDKLTDEFKRISSEGILRDYEKKNRERISDASLIVKDAFDKKWKQLTGNNYYQPVTTVQPPIAAFGKNNTQRSDPRSRKYLSMVRFSKIMWSKTRRKIGKRFQDMFTLDGIVAETEAQRPIFQNLFFDRLKEILGAENAKKIVDLSKDKNDGELSGEFDLNVEGYWEVQFSPAKSENDPIDVALLWEGQCLIIKRMEPVVLPGFYIEVADNATRDHYTQTPESGRKRIGVIQEYPYTVLREASREEYLAQKTSGDAVMRERLRKDEG